MKKDKIQKLKDEITNLNKENRLLLRHKELLFESHEELQARFQKVKQEYSDYVLQSKLSFGSIRRILVGKKGSGKTTFLKAIIPHLKDNYFIIDTFDEYKEFPEKNRFTQKINISIAEKVDSIKAAILENKSKIIIYDGFDEKDILDFIILQSVGLNFIVAAQSINRISKHVDHVDFIYNKGTTDNPKEGVDFPDDKMKFIFEKVEDIKFN
jgi:translation initiation factor RLI1